MITNKPRKTLLPKPPNTRTRGISLPGFLRFFPDNRSCIDYLFWARGGHAMTCRLCGKPTQWKPLNGSSKFRSRCCFTTLSATRGTPFYRSSTSLWTWFYTIVLILNLTASPSAGSLARHIGVNSETAWRILGKLRHQFSLICAQGKKFLLGKQVYVENLRFRNVLSSKGRKTSSTHVVVIAVKNNAFAFAIPRRHPFYYRQLLNDLGVKRDIFTYDFDFNRIGKKLDGFKVHLMERKEQDNSKDAWACFRTGRALAVYLTRSFRKWPVKVNRKYMQDYLSEFVFRFNFAQDKAMMFPLLITNLERVTYCDEAEARAKIERFDHRISRRLSG